MAAPVRTTTVRVEVETHARLVALAAESGASLQETVRAATDALGRQRFATRVADELATLRQDSEAWASYLAEAGATDVADGIG